MSRGHGRRERIILETVNGTRYGCTIRQLAYATFAPDRGEAPTEGQLASVRRVVDRLLREERVVERVMLGIERYILPAQPSVATTHQTLQCLDCDVRWVSEEGAPHPDCWSCGRPGRPAKP
jgi:hypothetical protein